MGAIIQALAERDILRPGRRGLGFAMGSQKLPAIFVARGAEILASDAPSEQHWGETGEHVANGEALFYPDCIDRADFDERVQFQPIDMNDLSSEEGDFDFLWSSCALEHLGLLEAGTQFVMNAMRLMKPGRVAVHTAEFNCSSNSEMVETDWNVVYRRSDLEKLACDLRLMSCGAEAFDFNPGTHPFDLEYDQEPYLTRPNAHIKLMIGGFVSTSFLLKINKGH